MFSSRLGFLLSCLCSKVRGEPGSIVARLPWKEEEEDEGEERDGWEAEEERDKLEQGELS